jgi:hypothetical protein
MKKIITLIAVILISYFNVSAQAKKTKFVKYQYLPELNTKTLTGTISNTFTTLFNGEEMYWFKINNTFIVHVSKKDLDQNMRIGSTYTFKGIKRLFYNVEEPKTVLASNAP